MFQGTVLLVLGYMEGSKVVYHAWMHLTSD